MDNKFEDFNACLTDNGIKCVRWGEVFSVPSGTKDNLKTRWCEFWSYESIEEYNKHTNGEATLDERMEYIRKVSELKNKLNKLI